MKLVTLLLLSALTHSLNAEASLTRNAGIGSRSSALAGTSAVGHHDGFSIAQNPAAVAGKKEESLRISWGLLLQDPQFKPISQVVVANPYTSDTFRIGNVDVDYPTTFTQALGLSFGISDDPTQWWNLSFGLTAVFPLDTIAEIDTGETFVPEYALYRSGAKKPEILFGFGMQPHSTFRFGAGLQMGLAVDAETNLFLQNSVDRPSTLRLKARTKPRVAPYFGILFSPGETAEKDSNLKLGATVRLPLKSPLSLYLTPSARVFGTSAAGLDFNVTAGSTLFYEPLSLELGGSLKHQLTHSTPAELFVQVNYEAWKAYESPSIRITNTATSRCEDPTYCGISFSNGRSADMQLRNIFVFQVGEAVDWTEADTTRIGYAYRPGIFKSGSQNAEVGNLLDPDSHKLTLGYGRKFKKIFGSSQPLSLDLHVSLQKLETRYISKTSGIENGIAGVSSTQNQKIGSPGYTVGGYIYGAGATLSLAF